MFDRFLFTYWITPYTNTGRSPAELLMNRKLNSALNLLRPNMDSKLGRKREEVMIQRHCQLQQFNLNDTVWVRNYNVSGKWVPGIIVSRTGPVSYVVQVSEGK